MPFAEVAIPSIQLATLESYLKKRNINITTRHLYLKAADIYRLKNYSLLINSPAGPYAAQMVFSKYVFPDHWEKNKQRFKEYFKKTVSNNTKLWENFTFEDYVRKTDQFYNWVIKNVKWQSYDIIGFTLNYGQFLPSLAVAKKIKEINPGKKIILGGSRTTGELGKKVLEVFNFVDFIVSGDGEETLHLIAINDKKYQDIPGLIYRDGKKIIWNESDQFIDLNTLPVLDFDSYYKDLSLTSMEIQQFYHVYGRLPVEISRGCWWNKCTFCNLNIQHKKYREKNVEKIVEEIKFLYEKYKILSFQIIANTLPVHNYRNLCKEIKKIGKDFTFTVEARAGQLKSEDYTLLKNAGFTTLQTGIESFSQNYLKKINKGTRVIDNIAALKFCRENRITNRYNIIVNYPNEEEKDFKETEKNIQLFKQYLDPPNIANLEVGYGSPIYHKPNEFNIACLDYLDIDKIMFPMEVLEKRISFFYSFKRKNETSENNWSELVEDWRRERRWFIEEVYKKQLLVDKLVFYFIDGGDILKIYDKRKKTVTLVYVLDEVEREIFLSCTDVVSFKELQDRFPDIPEYQLAAILYTFEKKGILFREDDRFLSLPLSYRKWYGIDDNTIEEVEKHNIIKEKHLL